MSRPVAVVTGAGSGIGRATCEALTDDGWTVARWDRDDTESGITRVDVTDGTDVTQAAAITLRDHGQVSALVNVAGIGSTTGIADTPIEEWKPVFEVNVFSLVRTTQALLPSLREMSGSIVNIASTVAHVGVRNRSAYTASKGAVLSLTRAMAADLLGDGIRVNSISPGTIETEWVGRLLATADDPGSARDALTARQPIGRLGSAHEIAAAVVMLLSDRSTFTTGSDFVVDGGMTSLRI